MLPVGRRPRCSAQWGWQLSCPPGSSRADLPPCQGSLLEPPSTVCSVSSLPGRRRAHPGCPHMAAGPCPRAAPFPARPPSRGPAAEPSGENPSARGLRFLRAAACTAWARAGRGGRPRTALGCRRGSERPAALHPRSRGTREAGGAGGGSAQTGEGGRPAPPPSPPPFPSRGPPKPRPSPPEASPSPWRQGRAGRRRK